MGTIYTKAGKGLGEALSRNQGEEGCFEMFIEIIIACAMIIGFIWLLIS